MRAAGMLMLCLLCHCSDDKTQSSPSPTATATTTVAPSAKSAAVAPTSSAAAPPAKPVCERVERKVWGQGANPRTGLTATRLDDGGIVIGSAIHNTPHKLVFDENGAGAFTKVKHKIPAGPEFKKGVRHLQRITVAKAAAFADYRDKHEDGKRRIACGPVDGEPYLLYEGMPLIAADDSGRGRKKTPAASTSAEASASAAAPPPPPPPPPPVEGDKPSVELRDCRTFSDADAKDVWSVGSELRGEGEGDDKTWKMRFFALTGAGKGKRYTLHEQDLGASPKKLHTLEAPVAHRLSDGTFVLAGRYRGRMLAWLLNENKSRKTGLHGYPGGYPSLPRVLADGDDHILLTSQKATPKAWKLRALRLSSESKLAKALLEPDIGDEGTSLAEPTFARVGDQRWLAYHAGDRRQGKITVVPVSKDLEEEGQAFVVTSGDEAAYESFMFATKDGKLVVVYISRPEKGKTAELISETLRCEKQAI